MKIWWVCSCASGWGTGVWLKIIQSYVWPWY